jgi:hypothetical protein
MIIRVLALMFLILIAATATAGVLFFMYSTFILGNDTPLIIILTFFTLILYSNILSKIWLGCYRLMQKI